ncbi:MAG: flagellar motor protein MotB [Planctomycetota bacterium]
MRSRRQTVAEQRPKVPSYIVTFADMVTLLLTFFVMLLSLAQVQDPELYGRGRDAFLESLRYIGLGPLFGRQQMTRLGAPKNKYVVPEPDESTDRRTLDARAEELRRILKKLKQLTTIVSSQIVGRKVNYSITNIRFSPGRVDLDESAKKFLTGFCRDLQLDVGRTPVELYVLGLASGGNGDKEKWLLSARRAQAVADFLRDTLSSATQVQRSVLGGRLKWSVHSWGAGPGGAWVGRNSPISGQSQILIGVLRPSD